MPVKVGVQLHPQVGTVDELRAAWKAADAMGADSVWIWDHFFPLYGDPDGAHFECWTMLGAWAEQTSRIQIGALRIALEKKQEQAALDAIAKVLESPEAVHLYLTSHLLYGGGNRIITFSNKKPLLIIYKVIGTMHVRMV